MLRRHRSDSATDGSDCVCCWLTEPELVALGAAPQLADYIERAQAQNFVPTRGSVDVLIGGPPCQGVRACMCVCVRTCICVCMHECTQSSHTERACLHTCIPVHVSSQFRSYASE